MNDFSCSIEGTSLILNGEVNIETVGKTFIKFNKNSAKYTKQKVSEIDCGKIKNADSSCLAFLVYLQTVYQDLVYVNLPTHLILLVELYDLKHVIKLKL